MRLLTKAITVLALVACALTARADWAYTYAGLSWDFSTSHSGFTGCDTLYLDATGDPGSPNAAYTLYGTLFCPGLGGGSYAVDGAAFFSGASFNFTVDIGVGSKLVCNNLSSSTFSGTCTMYTGGASSSAFVTFL